MIGACWAPVMARSSLVTGDPLADLHPRGRCSAIRLREYLALPYVVYGTAHGSETAGSRSAAPVL
jgi:hypothetical protein